MMTVIIFLASLFSCLITYLATQDLFKKLKPEGTPKKKIASKEIIFLICLGCLVVLPVIQQIIQAGKDHQVAVSNDLKAHIHDSTQQVLYDSSLFANTLKIKSSFDSGNDKQTAILSKTLGEYNLALDSANNRIVRLVKDSSKTRVVEPENPTLFVDKISLNKKVDDNFAFSLIYYSIDATSVGFNISRSMLLADSNFTNLRYVNTVIDLSSSEQIEKNHGVEKTFGFSTNQKFSYVILWINGTYKNHDESKTFPINTVYYYGYPSAINGNITGETKEKIIALVKSQTKK